MKRLSNVNKLEILSYLMPEEIGAVYAAGLKHDAEIDDVLWKSKLEHHFPREFKQLNVLTITSGNWYHEFARIYTEQYAGLVPLAKKLFSLVKENNFVGLGDLRDHMNASLINGITPVYLAASNGQLEMLKELHRLGANLNAPGPNGATPAFVAAYAGDVALLSEIHRLGGDLSIHQNDGSTPAFAAAQQGHVAVLTELHCLEVDLNTLAPIGGAPAFVAAQQGHVAVLTELHRLGVDLNIPGPNGETPAFVAARQGRVTVLTELHRLEVDLNEPMEDGITLAFIAASHDRVTVLAELHRLGFDVNEPIVGGVTPAFIAVYLGHVAVLTELHRLGVDLNMPGPDDRTLAFVAAQENRPAVFSELKRLGIDLNIPGPNQIPPAFIAAHAGHAAALTELYRLGVDLNTLGPGGGTIAQVALHEIMPLLNAWGVNLNVPDHEGRTPFYFAILNNKEEKVNYFLTTAEYQMPFIITLAGLRGTTAALDVRSREKMEAFIVEKTQLNPNALTLSIMPYELAHAVGNAAINRAFENSPLYAKPTIIRQSRTPSPATSPQTVPENRGFFWQESRDSSRAVSLDDNEITIENSKKP